MSQKFSEPTEQPDEEDGSSIRKSNVKMLILLPIWVFISFSLAQIIVTGFVLLLNILKVPLETANQTILNSILTSLIYLLTLIIVVAIPWLIKNYKTSKSDIGITRLPLWSDIFISPAGLVVYLIFSSLLIILATRILPWFDVNQVQDVGFKQLNLRYEYILAFVTLVVIAPLAEEVLFRGYLYGKLKKHVPIWVAIIVTSVLFGSIHGAWNIAIDTFVLGIILCLLREFTGNIWASILLHMLKNGIAFYILFIYPTLLTTLVR